MALPGKQLQPGSTAPVRTLDPLLGPPVAVPDPERLVHLQFRRFAGCPVCHLHLRSVVRRHEEIEAAGIREVVVFHSPAEELTPHLEGLPFPVVADPGKRLYTAFGVDSSPRALLSPRAWGPVVRAVTVGTWEMLRGRARPPVRSPQGGRLGLPGDFLIGTDGRIVAAKYGEHLDDQWPVDELLAHAAASRLDGLTPTTG
ncbi:peroxiredoxin-like family protein [Streptomyces sp. NBC_01353]|uniref:peroxiredoxin-like family protein n=1 Tax=Streptomyces sp. NBC_01353 TaxID=2903835 RepID=UPI002E37D337|nr:peroxiredoxin-like family protein [Streptomyces sp. NBC_01353]